MLKRVMAAFLLVLTGNLVLLAGVPPVSRDALIHHLSVPKIYLTHGGIHEIPYLIYSYYPMTLDLLYMLPIYLGCDIAAKYIHMLFGLLTGFLIYRYLSKRVPESFAWLGPVFFLSIPVIVKLSVSVYVDLGLVFFSTASLLIILEWRNRGFPLKLLLGGAVCTGIAMGIKYNGLVTFFILVMLVMLLFQGDSPGNLRSQAVSLGYGILFAAVALIFFSPWMIRNVIWTGNPVYPLYDGKIGISRSPDEKASESQKQIKSSPPPGHFAVRHLVMGESLGEILLIPVRIFFQGKDDSPKYFDGRLNPFLILLPLPLVFFSKARRRGLSDEGALTVYAVFFILLVFLKQDMRIRWITPALPPLVILCVLGLSLLHKKFKFPGRIPAFLTTFIVLGAIGCNIPYLLDLNIKIAPMEYLAGRISKEAYIKRYRPEYSVLDYANQNLKGDSRLLSMYLGRRFYYSDLAMVPGTDIFTKAVKESSSPVQVSLVLSRLGFTHVVVGTGMFEKWGMGRFSREEREVAVGFFKEFPLLFWKDGYGIYGLNRP